ncbi:MAG: D-alanyl-D-alanine carboxypeptidase/D-alanyl-D-alanine endopeptidase [Planctomycetota bacterium]|jgi:D-alanyl-D-alanine carboxypeptidase/D-alanyl-D-alanine-endopeptidase (penicillin-binding protein 4)
MSRILREGLGVLILAQCIAGPAAADLRDEVVIEIKRARLSGATVAVSVRDAETGTALVSINADEPLIPASNMKMLTTGAALHVLGPGFEFKTRLLRDGDRLIIVGDGDPAFGDPDLLELMQIEDQVGIDVETFIGLWVRPLVETGPSRIAEIVVDDRIFDRQLVHPGWPADQLNRRYCAQVSGFNFHLNVLHFYPRPGSGHRPVLSLFHPYAPWLEPVNRATSRTGVHDRNDVWIARRRNSNALTFYGNVKYPYQAPAPVTVHDMAAFFARLFADRLTEAGVSVERYRLIGSDEPRGLGERVAPVISTPISTAVTRCNRDSQNLYAECLIKRIGHALTNEPGSWVNGPAIVRHVVHERLGNPNLAANVVVSDGSGLSRANRIAAETLTAWLGTFHHDERLGPMFIESLAVAGESGTLAKRFRQVDLHGATVRAKSGYIQHVSCLSGYVTMPDGRRRPFSILVNGLREPGAVGKAKKMQERILAAIAWDMAAVEAKLGRTAEGSHQPSAISN